MNPVAATIPWQLTDSSLEQAGFQGYQDLNGRWCSVATLWQLHFRCFRDLLPGCVNPTPKDFPGVLCLHATLRAAMFACGIGWAAVHPAHLSGPKICAMSTSCIALRKKAAMQIFLSMSILENTYVARSKAHFEKQVSFWCEWVGIMKISAQVTQMFALSLLRTGKTAMDCQSS